MVFEKEKSGKTKMLFGEYKKSHRISKEERLVLLLFILTCTSVLFIVTVTQIRSEIRNKEKTRILVTSLDSKQDSYSDHQIIIK